MLFKFYKFVTNTRFYRTLGERNYWQHQWVTITCLDECMQIVNFGPHVDQFIHPIFGYVLFCILYLISFPSSFFVRYIKLHPHTSIKRFDFHFSMHMCRSQTMPSICCNKVSWNARRGNFCFSNDYVTCECNREFFLSENREFLIENHHKLLASDSV